MKKRILFISGSVGLGHITRDLAMARAIRSKMPDVEIVWLSGKPADRVLKEKGEQMLPERYVWEDETSVVEATSDGTGLNLIRYMIEVKKHVWTRHVPVFREIMKNEKFDLVIGDETYALSIAIKERKMSIDVPFFMIYDFIGVDTTGGGLYEKLAAYITNRNWVKPVPDLLQYCFVGEAEDVPDKPFGLFLPNRREWTRRRCHILGYVVPFDPDAYRDSAQIKARLGYDERPLIIVSIGGTSVGRNLLDLSARAFTILKQKNPTVQMVLVCGPRLDTSSLKVPEGVKVKGFVEDLYEHFAACDLAVVQGGNTTTIELTALRRPFICFPIEGHFEQMQIAERLQRHRAGVTMTLSATSPKALAEKMDENLGKDVDYARIPTDGARRMAQLVAEQLKMS